METWQRTAIILSLYGILIEFRPSEPFFIEYAIEYKNFTALELIHEILPATSYASFVSILVLLFITDFLRYKPVLIFGALASVAVWSISMWAYTDKTMAEVRQVVTAMALSTELAYFTYMYTNIERKDFKKVTSYIHSALHIGQFFAGLVAQVLITTKTMTYQSLNYLSLGGAGAALVLSFFLPTPKKSLYFYPRASIVSVNLRQKMRNEYNATQLALERGGDGVLEAEEPPHPQEQEQPKLNFPQRVKKAFKRFSRDFKDAYGNRHVLKWSLWWAIAYGVYLQVFLYSEPLWRLIEEETHQDVYNGAVHASHGLLSAALGIGIALIKFPFLKWGEIYLSGISFLQAATLIVMSQTHHLYVAYGCYIIFLTLFETMIIIVAAEVAKGLKEDSQPFIFGLNSLLAYTIHIIMSYSMLSSPDTNYLRVHIREAFLGYALYCALLGFLFVILAIQNRNKEYDIENTDDVSENSHDVSENSNDGKISTIA